jgi:ribonuclease P/MRP protein subunit POP5
MKHLPKHLQPRWRYLAVAVETWPGAQVDRDSFQRAVWHSARTLLGDTGSARLDLSVLRFQCQDGSGEAVVRSFRGEVERARAVVASIERVDDDPVGLRVRGTSGTIRGCEEKYMGRRRVHSTERDVAFDGANRTALVWSERADIRVDDAFAGATTLEL